MAKTTIRKNYTKWLYPNLKVKRWFLLVVLGIVLLGIGFVIIFSGERLIRLEDNMGEIIYRLKENTPYGMILGLLMIGGGISAIVAGFNRMVKSIASALLPENERDVVDVIFDRQHLSRGPKVVVIGGGTGLSALLRGLKEYTGNLTAIVTVADDGGSSGKLRSEMGVLPPGDIRNCLVALADRENVMEKLFSYRFDTGTLAGHSLGNLFLAGLADTYGDLQKSIEHVSKVFALRGTVYPSTLEQVTLVAEFTDGRIIKGETNIRTTLGSIKKVSLDKGDCRPVDEALRAIEEADLVILGPGSLYTSVIPNLLVKGLTEKIREVSAPCIYVCNVMTEPGETDNYSVSDHLKAIIDHVGDGLIDAVLANKQEVPPPLLERYALEGSKPVERDIKRVEALGVKYYEADLLEETEVVRHNPTRLAKELMVLLFRLMPRKKGIALVDTLLLAQKLRR